MNEQMNWKDFEDEISKLRLKYGKTLFDSTKCGIIFDRVRDLTIPELKNIIDHFCAEDVRAKLSDFEKAATNMRNKRNAALGSNRKCDYCKDSGWVLIVNNASSLDFEDHRCVCQGGDAEISNRAYQDRLEQDRQIDEKYGVMV